MADLICECMPAIVLSHISLAWLCTAVLLKTCRHSFMPKKDASISSMASLKSSSSPPRFVKNDILATSLTHICIWVCPLLSFFCASSLVVALSLANRMMLLTSWGSLRVVLLVSLLWILCPDTCVNVSLSIAGCMLLVMTPNVAAPAVISSKRDIPVINITRLLCGVSVHCILTFFGGGWNLSDW